MSNLVCLSTGESIKVFQKKLARINNADFLAFGNSYLFAVDVLKIVPRYWLFGDPHSICDSMLTLLTRKKVYNTELIVLTPVHNSIEDARKHHGTPGRHIRYDWLTDGFKKFNTDLDKLSRFIKVKRVPAGSYKATYWDDMTDFKSRMFAMLTSGVNILPVHGFSGDKLHSILLPVVTTYLDYDHIYIAGFDGMGGRFNHATSESKQRRAFISQDKFLPCWADWLRQMNKSVHSLIPPQYARTTKFFPYTPISTLIKDNV